MYKCKQCGKEYEAKRSTSVYCGPKCKQEFYRNRMSPAVTVRNAKAVTVTEQGNANQLKANQAMPNMRRGKDIQCFADLSPSVQASINRISDSPEEKRRRTGMAIRYQHLFPDRYHATGVVFTLKMTVMERLFYRPGQCNFVSLPGRACHGVY